MIYQYKLWAFIVHSSTCYPQISCMHHHAVIKPLHFDSLIKEILQGKYLISSHSLLPTLCKIPFSISVCFILQHTKKKKKKLKWNLSVMSLMSSEVFSQESFFKNLVSKYPQNEEVSIDKYANCTFNKTKNTLLIHLYILHT